MLTLGSRCIPMVLRGVHVLRTLHNHIINKEFQSIGIFSYNQLLQTCIILTTTQLLLYNISKVEWLT